MFDGRNYHQAFEKTLDEIASRPLDRDEALGQLVGLEWTLWEAIRGAMIKASCLAGLIVVVPLGYLLSSSGSFDWVTAGALFAVWLFVCIGLYWLFKFAAFSEIGRHIKGRRFGELDLPWLPRSSNYHPTKYPIE